MENRATVDTERKPESTEVRREWIAPELKKIDIEEVTANGGFLAADGTLSS